MGNGNLRKIKDYFDFEKKKHFEFFLPFYQQKNWQLVEDNIDSNQKNDWDVKLEIKAGIYRTIDEKARKKDYNDCLVEIMQDMETGGLGWFYGKKDWILYGSWKEETIYPSSLYLISSERLKKYILSIRGIISTNVAPDGWGITWNIILNWDNLIRQKIAVRLI